MKSLILVLNVVLVCLWFRYRWKLVVTPSRIASRSSVALWLVSICFYVAYALGAWVFYH